jgi:hypothetical protein
VQVFFTRGFSLWPALVSPSWTSSLPQPSPDHYDVQRLQSGLGERVMCGGFPQPERRDGYDEAEDDEQDQYAPPPMPAPDIAAF